MIHGTGRIKRLIAGGAVALLGLSLAPSAGAVISTAAFCANVPQGQSGFTDIAQAGDHARNVECLKASAITSGKTATTYAPTEQVSRAQMATFIANMVRKAGELDAPGGPTIPSLPSNPPDKFTDDEDTGGHEANINALAAAGIVSGQTSTTYNPTGNVQRRQMATFIAQALAFIRGGALPVGEDRFTDDNGDTHEANINRLANADIIAGQTATTFNPFGDVSRAQMASFIIQAMADLHADGFITALPPASGGQFNVAGDADTRQVAANPAAPTTAELRTCTVSGLTAGTTVDVRVIPSADVNAAFQFKDSLAPPNQYDETDTTAIIYNINGANIVNPNPATNEEVDDITVSPVGAISVTFGSTASGDFSLLVWQDTGVDNDVLDLVVPSTANTNNKTPAEPFGVGCRTFFTHPEAGVGTTVGVQSNTVNRDADFLADNTINRTFFWDANDVFQFSGIGITQAQFEGILSRDNNPDTLTIAYNPDAAGVSTFNITADAIGDPTAATATVVNADAGAVANDVRVVFTPDPDNGPATVFDVVADTTDDNAITAADTVLGNNVSCTVAADGTCTLTFNNAPNGTYNILVRAENPPSGVTSNLAQTADVTVPAAADTTAPQAVDTELTTNGGFATRIDAGDVIKVCFNEAMRAPDAGDSIQVTDGDDVATITNGSGATFALGGAVTTDVDDNVAPVGCPANQTLVITLTANPVDSNTGTGDNIISVGATITDASGVTDVAGNNMSVAAGERVIDVEAGPEPD